MQTAIAFAEEANNQCMMMILVADFTRVFLADIKQITQKPHKSEKDF